MKFLSRFKIGDFLSGTAKKLLDGAGGSFSSYSDLDAPINRYTFASENSRLGSIIHIKGLRKYAMTNEYREILDSFAAEMSPFLKNKSHKFQFTFVFDPDRTRVKKYLRKLYSGAYTSMNNIGLDLHDIYDTSIDKLAGDYCVITDLFLCVWTNPVGNETKPIPLFPTDADECARGFYSESVLDNHMGMIRKIPSFFNMNDIDARLLDLNEALKGIRERANPGVLTEKWKPQIYPLDRLPAVSASGESIMLYPKKLSMQVAPGFCEIPSFDKLVIQDQILARSLDVERFGGDAREFDDLLNKIARANIPTRLTYTVTGGAAQSSKFSYQALQAGLASNSNEKSSQRNLQNHLAKHGVVVGIQMTASTWVDVPEGYAALQKFPEKALEVEKKLNRNFQSLVSHITSWGGVEPNVKGDTPLYAWTRNNAGFCSSSDAPMSFAPVIDAFRMLPLHIMSPIWTDSASIILRTPNKVTIPFNRMASNQKYSFIVMIGRMRSGKSVFLGALIRSLATFPGLKELPLISIIDVGQTSFGTLDLIQDGLVERKRHQVVKYVLKNDAQNAINPFHLPMGLRIPVQSKKDALISFLKLLICDENVETEKGVEGMLASLIDATYRKLNDSIDSTSPNIYEIGRHTKLDTWLDEVNYIRDGSYDIEYWELFDFFFEQGDYKKAHYCQACASPLLSDMIAVIGSQEFRGNYDEKQVDAQKLCSDILTAFTDALRLYPILSSISFLNLDEAKILSLDLGDVATSGVGSIKKVAVMYSLAMDVAVRNFFITEETLKEIPADYYDYHKDKYNQIKSQPKGLYMDELHRATDGKHHSPIAQLTMKQILDYVRVASKEQIEFGLFTQMVDDVTPELLELSTTNIVLSVASKGEDKVLDAFGIDYSFKPVLKKLGNPSEHGSMMLIQNETTDAQYTHVVYNTVPAEEIWGQASYRIDVLIRDGLYKLLPKAVTRKALAKRFPKCTAKAEAENYEGDLDDLTLDQQNNLVDRIIQEVYELGRKMMLN